MYDYKCIEIAVTNEWTIRLIIGSDVRRIASKWIGILIIHSWSRLIDT